MPVGGEGRKGSMPEQQQRPRAVREAGQRDDHLFEARELAPTLGAGPRLGLRRVDGVDGGQVQRVRPARRPPLRGSRTRSNPRGGPEARAPSTAGGFSPGLNWGRPERGAGRPPRPGGHATARGGRARTVNRGLVWEVTPARDRPAPGASNTAASGARVRSGSAGGGGGGAPGSARPARPGPPLPATSEESFGIATSRMPNGPCLRSWFCGGPPGVARGRGGRWGRSIRRHGSPSSFLAAPRPKKPGQTSGIRGLPGIKNSSFNCTIQHWLHNVLPGQPHQLVASIPINAAKACRAAHATETP